MKLELKFHPAADKPGKALAMAFFLAFMSGLMFCVLNSVLVVGLLLALMIYNLIPFFFPTYYTLDDKCVTVSRLGKKRVYAWDGYRSFTVENNGVVLWTVPDIHQAQETGREKMAVLRSSVFLLMTPQMIEQAGGILRSKLAETTKKD